MAVTSHEILGEQVRMPVEIRSARAGLALFAVPVGPTRDLLEGTGLVPVQPVPGRALCSLVFIRYADGDLGPYHEFGVAFLSALPGKPSTMGVYIHWLPVNQSFTLEAGRSIWGFPKEMADIDMSFSGAEKYCRVQQDGRSIVTLRTRRGLPVPAIAAAAPIDAYTFQDGVLRRTPWRMRPSLLRSRIGGARVELGDHPMAEQLRDLGLPRAALATSELGKLGMTFQDAQEVT